MPVFPSPSSFRQECSIKFWIKHNFWFGITYSIKWESKDWDIRNYGDGQAKYIGPTRKGVWDLVINKDCSAYGHAHITRALSSHFYGSNPFDKARTTHKIKIAYRNRHNTKEEGHFNYPHAGGIFRNIVLYGLDSDGSYKKSGRLIATTFHELGHCAMYHAALNLSPYYDYTKYNKIIRESWASMIEWYMLKNEYKDKKNTLFEYISYVPPVKIEVPDPIVFEVDNNYNKQHMTQYLYNTNTNNFGNYTPLFIDLIDDSNQREFFRLFKEGLYETAIFPNDELCIPDCTLISSLMYQSFTLQELKANLHLNKEKLNITDQAINNYFEFYGL